MGEAEGREPQQQHQVIKHRAPQEQIAECEVIHVVSRFDSQHPA
jgi:hypothetical protein